jgi:hypothetical protein
MTRFYSVQLWTAPWTRAVKVAKMYDNECMSGIGWISLVERDNYKIALADAKRARGLLTIGASDADIQWAIQ